MGGNCSTANCFDLRPFPLVPPGQNITIIADDYRGCGRNSPDILTIVFTPGRPPDLNPRTDVVMSFKKLDGTMIPIANIFLSDVSRPSSTLLLNGVEQSPGLGEVKFTLGEKITALNSDLILLIPNREYGVGDEYYLVHNSSKCPQAGRTGAFLYFVRTDEIKQTIDSNSKIGATLNSLNSLNSLNIPFKVKCSKKGCNNNNNNNNDSYCNCNNDCTSLSDCENVRVPAILIKAQTNSGGSDLGDAYFQICDEIQYYDKTCNDDDNTCKIRYIDTKDLKQTKFQQGNLNTVFVLKGEGHTACERLSNIYKKLKNESEITFLEFANNIMTYVVIRYILSKLIFGDFNMEYLLGKYYNTFIDNLGKSRFCAFLEIFLDCNSIVYDYDKYFRYSS
jgi:hypothetical protein